MAISNHQEIVVNYLCADPNIFVSEEYYVAWDGGGKDREIWVDAVAMEISRQVAYLVEVTADERASAIIKKLNGIYSPARRGTVRRAMLAGRGLPEGWDLRPWLFVKAAAAPRILANLPDGATPRITYLDERVAWAWEFEQARKAGDEPGKPYGDFDARYQ